MRLSFYQSVLTALLSFTTLEHPSVLAQKTLLVFNDGSMVPYQDSINLVQTDLESLADADS